MFRTRTLATRTTLAAALLLTAATPAASSHQRVHATYVVNTSTHVGYEHVTGPLETPVGSVRPLGWINVTTRSTRFSVTLDDAAALPGQTVPVVLVVQGVRGYREVCLRDGAKTTFTVPKAGARVTLIVTSSIHPGYVRCGRDGTAGTLDIVLPKG